MQEGPHLVTEGMPSVLCDCVTRPQAYVGVFNYMAKIVMLLVGIGYVAGYVYSVNCVMNPPFCASFFKAKRIH